MKFGMLHLFENPAGKTEHQIVKEQFDLMRAAEDLGFDSIWPAEHHFSEYGYCASPALSLAAVAAVTKRIRLGTGVVVLPFHNPIRVAEEFALLDLMSDGRVDFGVGRGYQPTEYKGFQIEQEKSRGIFNESLEIVLQAWTKERVNFKGVHFNIEDQEVRPKPLQKPHPPLWCASTGPETHEIAGRKGLGLLSFTLLVDPEELKRRIGIYRAGIAQAKPAGKFVNDRAATFTMVHCAETDKEARATAKRAFEWYARKAFEAVASVGIWQSGKTDMGTYDYLKQMLNVDPATINFDHMEANDMIICGNPDTCIKKVKRYQEAGCQQLLCFMQIYDIPHQKIMDSIKLWGQHVIPYFK